MFVTCNFVDEIIYPRTIGFFFNLVYKLFVTIVNDTSLNLDILLFRLSIYPHFHSEILRVEAIQSDRNYFLFKVVNKPASNGFNNAFIIKLFAVFLNHMLVC